MNLSLDHLIPAPITLTQNSEVWNRELQIEQPEKILFRAPSGKGKSTLIHILYGLRTDYSGAAFWEGKNSKEQDERQWASWRKNELSIVFQDLRLFDNLNVLENIELKQTLTKTVSTEQIKEWLSFLGLEKKFQQSVGTLSYGEKQRVAIVRALVQPFSWLLMDEPFSHLDEENIEKATSLITSQIQKRNAGLLLVDLENHTRFDFSRKILL